MSKTTVSYNATWGDLSAAYLEMWSALQAFDPEADRWSEPVDFGGSDERVERADKAVRKARTTMPAGGADNASALDEELTRDYERFGQVVARIREGAPFDSEMRAFADSLGKKGSRFADDSVSLASSAER